MTYYLAFTLGPIYDTLRQARKTRELWAASYIFSALMRELLEELKKEGELLAPIVRKGDKNGAGIYPDRCFLKFNKEIDAVSVKTAVQNTLDRVSNLLPQQPRGFRPADHFRVFAAQISSDEKSDNSPILQLNNILDGLELQGLIPEGDVQLIKVLEDNTQNQSLYKDGGKNDVFITFDNGRQQRLPSLLELATSELDTGVWGKKYKDILTDQTNESILIYQEEKRRGIKEADKHEADAQENALLKLKKELGDAVKFRHKYVCFIKADGDSIGKTIAAIRNNGSGIQDFSTLLGKFADDAVGKIIEYGAIPVYAGGDDLLFIAPVQNAAGQHVFNLLDKIDTVWPGDGFLAIGQQFSKDFEVKPSLSFGVSISYYKYPMFEALDNMDELLFTDAKDFTGKNAVAFRVLKHSGQAFGATLGKGGEAYKKFSEVLVACRGQETAFLTSVMHKLTELQPYLEDALQNNGTIHFFRHHFNEQEHAKSASEKYLYAVRELCEAAWDDEKKRKEAEKKEQEKHGASKEDINKIVPEIKTVTNQVYAALRFVQFLNQEDHD